jgi:hypothetical protein
MTTKLIAAAMIIAVLWGGWHLFFYWEKVKNDQESERKQEAAAAVVGDQLPGMPYQPQGSLENSLHAAEAQGADGLRNWLKLYGASVQDPRKAWIELDYCIQLSREDPAEAKRVFAEVKARTPPTSPVWPRIKQLEKTYE